MLVYDYGLNNYSEALKILSAYARVMLRRRNYLYFRLPEAVYNGELKTITIIEDEKIAGVCGYYDDSLFYVTHFYAESDRLGYKLLKTISSNGNIVFAVTEDISPMLEKLGYVFVGTTEQYFNDEITTKYVYLSNGNICKFIVKYVKYFNLSMEEAIYKLKSLKEMLYNKESSQTKRRFKIKTQTSLEDDDE